MLNKRTYSGNTERTTQIGRTHYRPVISISNTNYRLMDALTERIGCGQVYQHQLNGDPRRPRSRAAWTWRLNAMQMRAVMPGVRPWLVLKGEQWDLLSEALAHKDLLTCRKGERGLPVVERERLVLRLSEIYQSIRDLNTRGRVVLLGGDAE